MIPLNPPRRSQSGFSLVELTIVVVILGVIAMIGVPKYRTVVERAKSSEALVFMHHVEVQQAGFQAWKGRYAKSFSELKSYSGSGFSQPKHFTISDFTSFNWETKWSLRLTRDGASSGFGAYTVSWDQGGFNAARSSIPSSLKPDGGGSAPISKGSGSSGSSGSDDSNDKGDNSGSEDKDDKDKGKGKEKDEDEKDKGKGKEKDEDDKDKGKGKEKDNGNNRDRGKGKKNGHDG